MKLETKLKSGIIESICISDKKGIPKKQVDVAKFIENFGIENDAHANSETRKQVSLLAMESIEKMKNSGLDVTTGSFAENITTSGINLLFLNIEARLKIGKDALIEITQIGKNCHKKCPIFYKAGYCVMPTEGVFAKVIKGGTVKKGSLIKELKPYEYC
ncbi:MAG: MOSC domain-containing protein [Elusimicrobia bacterium]|nr:MOSC domain-containing protein [Elusimicrobiota bacterium]